MSIFCEKHYKYKEGYIVHLLLSQILLHTFCTEGNPNAVAQALFNIREFILEMSPTNVLSLETLFFFFFRNYSLENSREFILKYNFADAVNMKKYLIQNRLYINIREVTVE